MDLAHNGLQQTSADITILHVDEDEEFFNTVKTNLEKDIFSFIHADTVEKGLNIFKTRNVDCIISDYNIASQTGLYFLKQVRNIDEDIPFIILTSDGSENIASEAISNGATDYLQKMDNSREYKVLNNRIKNYVEKNEVKKSILTQNRILKTEKEFINQSINHINDLFYVMDKDGELTRWNNSIDELIFGTNHKKASNIYFEDIFGEENDSAATLFNKTLRGQNIRFKTTITRYNGDEIRYEFKNSPLKDYNGNIIGVVGVGRDITKQEKQEKELSRKNTILYEILNRLPVGVIVEEPSRRVLHINNSTIDILSINSSIDNIVGKEIDYIINKIKNKSPNSDEFIQYISDITTERKPIEGEKIYLDDKVIELYYMPYKIDGEKSNLWMINDITEQQKQQNKLKLQNEKLNKFSKIITHDIRNPLSIAQGYIELAMYEEDNEVHINKTHDAITRIDNIVNDMLKMIKNPNIENEIEEIHIGEISEQCWSNIQSNEQERLIVNDNGTIEANRSLLTRLLENIFKNIRKHAGNSANAYIGTTDNGFYIEDDGVGIDDATKDKLFNQSFTTSESGLGLGLTIVKSIADTHNWDIEILDSDEGGVRFEFTSKNAS